MRKLEELCGDRIRVADIEHIAPVYQAREHAVNLANTPPKCSAIEVCDSGTFERHSTSRISSPFSRAGAEYVGPTGVAAFAIFLGDFVGFVVVFIVQSRGEPRTTRLVLTIQTAFRTSQAQSHHRRIGSSSDRKTGPSFRKFHI